MEYDDNEILDAFQSDYNREIEESFVNMLCDTEYLKLFFINDVSINYVKINGLP